MTLMTSHLSIGKKLMLACGTILALVLILAGASFWSVKRLGNELDTEITKTARKVALAYNIAGTTYQMRAAQRGVVMYSLLKQPQQVQKNKALFQSGAEELQKTLATIRPLIYKPESIQALNRIQSELSDWIPRYNKLIEYCNAQQFGDELSQLVLEIGAANIRMNEDASVLLRIQREIQDEASNSAAATKSASWWLSSLLSILCLVIGIIVLFIVRQVNNALREIAAEMADGAHQVTEAASQISSSSQTLAEGASEQAAALEETSASAEQISSMTRKNFENSKSAADNMEEASRRIDEANRNLEQMLISMDEINTCSGKIGTIIKVIDDIAFQTNILALNAAVEAARAGEAGMGFAVVADEVRNLAQRCAHAARDTGALIEESISKSNAGKNKLEQVVVAVHSITDSAKRVNVLVSEVNTGSAEQSRGIEEVAKAITQMESVTRSTAANAEEGAAASEELTAQAETLRNVVFRLNSMLGATSGVH